jgi:hypothetical protein
MKARCSRDDGRDGGERKEQKPVVESLATLREAGKRAPRLFGIASGVEGLDDLFFATLGRHWATSSPSLSASCPAAKATTLNLSG